MIKKLLIRLRQNYPINFVIRNSLFFISRFFPKLNSRFIRLWPVKGNISIKFSEINFLINSDCDDGVADGLFYNQSHVEKNEIYIFSQLAKHSNVILDVGAHTGIYSIIAAKSNSSATIFSFEPHPSNFKRLEININLNKLENVHLINKAVGNTDSMVKFNIPEDNRIIDVGSVDNKFSAMMYEGDIKWKPIEVQQTSIDAFRAKENLKQIDLIKIDVENYELPVFKGMERVLKQCRPYIVCELFQEEDKIIYIDELLKANNYFVYDFTMDGLKHLISGVKEHSTTLNYLLSPKDLGISISYSDLQATLPR